VVDRDCQDQDVTHSRFVALQIVVWFPLRELGDRGGEMRGEKRGAVYEGREIKCVWKEGGWGEVEGCGRGEDCGVMVEED
jgi:hypothetical protein